MPRNESTMTLRSTTVSRGRGPDEDRRTGAPAVCFAARGCARTDCRESPSRWSRAGRRRSCSRSARRSCSRTPNTRRGRRRRTPCRCRDAALEQLLTGVQQPGVVQREARGALLAAHLNRVIPDVANRQIGDRDVGRADRDADADRVAGHAAAVQDDRCRIAAAAPRTVTSGVAMSIVRRRRVVAVGEQDRLARPGGRDGALELGDVPDV